MKRLISLVIGLLFIAACNNLKKSDDTAFSPVSSTFTGTPAPMESKEYTETAYSPDETSSTVELKIPEKMIKTAEIRMQVSQLDSSYIQLKHILANYKAYLGSDNRTQSDYEITQNMLIRVPTAQFDNILDELLKEGIYVNCKNITTQDITEQYIDIEARLKTKKQVEIRYLALLKEAKKISEILEVENHLRAIREEIESFEARMKTLNDQVAYSTINLSLYQSLEFKAKPSISLGSKIRESFSNGWSNLEVFTLGVITAWPFVLLILFIAIGLIQWRRRKK